MHSRISFVSADDHVIEPPNLWTDRIGSRWGDAVPHVARQPDGTDAWMIGGKPLPLSFAASIGAVMPDRAKGPAVWDEVPKMAYHPSERLLAMDADGVTTSVLYPMVAGVAGQRFGSLGNPELELACVKAYNDWLIDEWAAASPRFIPQCLIPMTPITEAVAEIRRAVGRGHRGVVMPGNPSLLSKDLPHVNEPDYDPIWKVCEELDVPVCFHSGSAARIQMPPYKGFSPAIVAALDAMTRPVSSTFLLANILFSGILVRFPKLKVVFSETTLAWGAYTLESADHQFERQRYDMAGWEVIPTQQFHRQCFLTGWYDRTGIQTRNVIGVPNMLWSSNFPQTTSEWPRSRDTIERCFAGVPEEERLAILVANASTLYKL